MRRSIHYWSLEQLLARLQSIARYVITVAHYFESMQNHSSCLELLVNSLISSRGNVKKQNASLSAQALWTCKKFKCNLLIIVLGYWVSIPQDFLTKDYFLWQTKNWHLTEYENASHFARTLNLQYLFISPFL